MSNPERWREKPYGELPQDIAQTLLLRLGHDDDFRAQFQQSPRMALADLGFAPARDPNVARGIWESMSVNRLADKATILASFNEMRRDILSARAAADPISLDQARTKASAAEHEAVSDTALKA